jgi:hypothetical protein
MKKIFLIILSLFNFHLFAQWNDNSAWKFQGPYSENGQNGNLFKTSRLTSFAIDPSKNDHVIAAGKHAGLWQSTDAGDNWTNISTTSIGSNGISAIAFRNNNELYASNYYLYNISSTSCGWYSNGVYKYTFSTDTWTQLGVPSSNHKYEINRIVFYPGSQDIVFLCTSMGLFKSTNAGSTWTLIESGNNICNMVFLQKPSPSIDYYCIISGTTTNGTTTDDEMGWHGTALLKKSIDIGSSFSDLDPNNTINTNYTQVYKNSNLCLGDINYIDGSYTYSDIYVYTAISNDASFGGSGKYYLVHKFKVKNDLSTVSCTLKTSYSESACTPDRLAIGFDSDNTSLWFGGVDFKRYNLNTSSLSSGGVSHSDIHDLIINTGGNYIYVASDGGMYRSSISSLNFTTINDNLNVCMINGFSCASNDPNYYVIGMQDIIYTDFYDAITKKPKYQHSTWENDGGMFDHFNNNLVIADASSYDADYYYSTNNGSSLTGSINIPDDSYGDYATGFGKNAYFQDPFTERLFYGLSHPLSFAQFDLSANSYIPKVHFANCGFIIGQDAGCYGGTGTGCPYDLWETQIIDAAFSKQEPNNVHFISCTSPVSDGGLVLHYVGPDFDNWKTGNTPDNQCYYTSGGNQYPQWENITPNWYDLSNFYNTAIFNEIPLVEDRRKFSYTSIVKSPLNPDVVYISADFLPNNGRIKVLKYQLFGMAGWLWTDYSNGIPSDEHPTAMVIDNNSNDGLYLATEKGIYFRDASMNSWESYSTGMPGGIYIKQMDINYKDKSIIAGTFGRGLWKSPLKCPDDSYESETTTYTADETVEADVIESTATVNNDLYIVYKGGTNVTLNPGFKALAGSHFDAFIQACDYGHSSKVRPAEFAYNDEEEDINERSQENTFTVFPNPNNGSMTVSYELTDNETGTLEIYDMMGKKLFTYSLYSGENTLSISEDGLNPGIYFYKAISKEDKLIASDKIVIIK